MNNASPFNILKIAGIIMSKEPDIARIYLLLENEGRAQFVIN